MIGTTGDVENRVVENDDDDEKTGLLVLVVDTIDGEMVTGLITGTVD